MHFPTRVRWLSDAEWAIVEDVFKNTLPWRARIFVTNAAGLGGAAFVLPTSAIQPVGLLAFMSTALHGLASGAADRAGQVLGALLPPPGSSGHPMLEAPARFLLGGQWRLASTAADKLLNVTGSLPTMVNEGPARTLSVANQGYLMNVGPKLYPDMTGVPTFLVHEMTHVWQSYNAVVEIDYALNSVYHQCKGFVAAGDARKAYAYTPGGWFKAYNVEQQASIVADWYAAGKPSTGFLWECIRDYIRTGTV